MIETEYMSKNLQNKLEVVCDIAKYLLATNNIMYSSADDGYDSVLNMYCFFTGNIFEYKEHKVSADIVLEENELTVASILADTIKTDY